MVTQQIIVIVYRTAGDETSFKYDLTIGNLDYLGVQF